MRRSRGQLGERAPCGPTPCAAGSPRTRTVRWAGPTRRARRSPRTGPGTTSTARPAAAAARTSRSPGSAMPGMPASVTTATRSPRPRAGRARRRRAAPRCGRSRPATSGRRSMPACCSSRPVRRVSSQQMASAAAAPRRRAATGRRGCRSAWRRGPACTGRARDSPDLELVADRRSHARTTPASASITAWARSTGRLEAPAAQRGDPQHDEVAVEEGDVDREAHAERVHRAGRAEEQRAVDARRGRAAPAGGRPATRPPRGWPAPHRRAAARPRRASDVEADLEHVAVVRPRSPCPRPGACRPPWPWSTTRSRAARPSG